MSRESLISKLLAELYDRQRPAASAKNKTLQKFTFAADYVKVADVFTATLGTAPFRYAPVVTGSKLIYGQGSWK